MILFTLVFCFTTVSISADTPEKHIDFSLLETVVDEDGLVHYVSDSEEQTLEIMESISKNKQMTRATGYTSVYEKIGGIETRFMLTKNPQQKKWGAGNSTISMTINANGGNTSHTVTLAYKDFSFSYQYGTPGNGITLDCPMSPYTSMPYCGIGTVSEIRFQRYREYQIPHSDPTKKYDPGIVINRSLVGNVVYYYHHNGLQSKITKKIQSTRPTQASNPFQTDVGFN